MTPNTTAAAAATPALVPAQPSLAAQAVACAPHTLAPTSFDGHNWLFVLNLALMTATSLLAISTVVRVGWKLATDRDRGPLVALLRWLALIGVGGMALRTGVEAINLWGWDPLDPVRTGWFLILKRVIDLPGASAYFVAICIFTVTEDAMVAALERKPYPKRLTATLPKLAAPVALVCIYLVAAIGVVATR